MSKASTPEIQLDTRIGPPSSTASSTGKEARILGSTTELLVDSFEGIGGSQRLPLRPWGSGLPIFQYAFRAAHVPLALSDSARRAAPWRP